MIPSIVLFSLSLISAYAFDSAIEGLCSALLQMEVTMITESWSCSSPPYMLCNGSEPIGVGVSSCSLRGEVSGLILDGKSLPGED